MVSVSTKPYLPMIIIRAVDDKELWRFESQDVALNPASPIQELDLTSFRCVTGHNDDLGLFELGMFHANKKYPNKKLMIKNNLLTSELKLLLAFDNQTLTDSSGNGNNGTMLGGGATEFQYSRTGFSLKMNGTDNRVNIPNESTFDFERTQGFTLIVSGKRGSSIGTTQGLITKRSSGAGWNIHFQSSNKLAFRLINTVTSNELFVETTKTFLANEYFLIVVTYDGSSTPGGVRVWNFGVELAKNTVVNNLSASILNNEEVHIGTNTSAGSDFYNAEIDMVGIVNREVTEDEADVFANMITWNFIPIPPEPCIHEQMGVELWVGKTQAGLRRVMYGIIDDVDYESDSFSAEYMFTGTGWQQRLKRRIVDIRELQKLDSNNDPDTSDTSTAISTLAKLIINETRILPINKEPLESQLSDTGITTNTTQLPDFIHRYTDMDTPLKALSDIVGGQTYGVDADRVVNLKITGTSSGILITNDPNSTLAQSWDSSKLGFYEGKFKWKSTSRGMVNRYLGRGPIDLQIDINQTTTNATYGSMHTNYLAIPFTPSVLGLMAIAPKAAKVGTPNVDYPIRILAATSGAPDPKYEVRKFSLTKERLGTFTSADFNRFEVGLPKIDRAQHFLVIDKGGDSSNRISFDYNTASGTYYDSTDGITWTPRTGTFALKTWWGRPVKTASEDSASRKKYRLLEDTFYDPKIAKRETMETVIQGRLTVSAKRYRTYPNITLSVLPDYPIVSGESIRIEDVFQGLDDTVVVKRVHYQTNANEDFAIRKIILELEDSVD